MPLVVQDFLDALHASAVEEKFHTPEQRHLVAQWEAEKGGAAPPPLCSASNKSTRVASLAYTKQLTPITVCAEIPVQGSITDAGRVVEVPLSDLLPGVHVTDTRMHFLVATELMGYTRDGACPGAMQPLVMVKPAACCVRAGNADLRDITTEHVAFAAPRPGPKSTGPPVVMTAPPLLFRSSDRPVLLGRAEELTPAGVAVASVTRHGLKAYGKNEGDSTFSFGPGASTACHVIARKRSGIPCRTADPETERYHLTTHEIDMLDRALSEAHQTQPCSVLDRGASLYVGVKPCSPVDEKEKSRELVVVFRLQLRLWVYTTDPASM